MRRINTCPLKMELVDIVVVAAGGVVSKISSVPTVNRMQQLDSARPIGTHRKYQRFARRRYFTGGSIDNDKFLGL